MATPKEIKLRIGAVEKIKKIASALEVVAFTRLKKIEEKTENARHYFDAIHELAFDMSKNLLYEAHPFLRARKEIKNYVAIVLSSDKGLCGDFNTNIERNFKIFLSKKQNHKGLAISVGKKGASFLKKAGVDVLNEYNSSLRSINYAGVSIDITNRLSNMFLKREIDEVVVVYNQFRRQFLGKPRIFRLLPLKIESFSVRRVRDYEYEPAPYMVLETLLKEYMANQLTQVILESNAAEEIARMLAMKKARDNADETINELNLQYHKQRQMRITRELIDITTAANA